MSTGKSDITCVIVVSRVVVNAHYRAPYIDRYK